MLNYQVYCYCVVGPPENNVKHSHAVYLDISRGAVPGYYDVGKLLGRHTEFFKSRLHETRVLVKNLVQVPAQLLNVPENPLGQPAVSVRVDEQLHVEHLPDLAANRETIILGLIRERDL